jgi:hypothetical protein
MYFTLFLLELKRRSVKNQEQIPYNIDFWEKREIKKYREY